MTSPRLGRRSHRSASLIAAPLLALALSALLTPSAPAQASPPSLTDVQSVYIYDFAKFVRWPASAEGTPLTICVAASRVYVESLTKVVKGESIAGRPLAVRALETPAELPGCNVLFIGTAAKERLPGLLAAADAKPVLTVSDIPEFLDRGGMIQFLVVGSRVRFSVNLGPAQRGNLSLSSELLKVAVAVNGAPPRGGRP